MFLVLINIGHFDFSLFKIFVLVLVLVPLFSFPFFFSFLIPVILNFGPDQYIRMCLVFTNIENFIFLSLSGPYKYHHLTLSLNGRDQKPNDGKKRDQNHSKNFTRTKIETTFYL